MRTEPENNRTTIHRKMAELRGMFVANGPYERLSQQFDLQLQRRRSAIELGIFAEARAIALIGASGSGKSTATNKLLTSHPNILQPHPDEPRAETVSLIAPTPATLKDVGAAIINALGYTAQRSKPAGAIWEQVRSLLRERKTLFVHLDEAQDLYSTKSVNVRSDVVNTLKSLMNNRDWPVGLILSGTPLLLDMINSDDQLRRRIDIVRLDVVSWSTQAREIKATFSGYVGESGLELCPRLNLDDLLPRLVHAGANEFGLLIELLLGGIEVALLANDTQLAVGHFAEAFRRKAACVPAMNPFLSPDYLAIDAKAVAAPILFGGRNALT